MITLWISLQAIVDVLILVAVLLYVYERKKRKKEDLNINLKTKENQELVKSLDRLIEESERSSIDISDKVLMSQQKGKELLDLLEKKQKELKKEIENANTIIEDIKKSPEPGPETTEPEPPEEDKYSEAAKLARAGLNAEEISKQLDLPKGEVELIIDLPIRNTEKNQ